MPQPQKFEQIRSEQMAAPTGINLVNSKNPVRQGDAGSLTIQGLPGIEYSITASYQIGDRTFRAKQSKLSGIDGRVTWTWNVDPNTVPGTYPITITGGGEIYNAFYVVVAK